MFSFLRSQILLFAKTSVKEAAPAKKKISAVDPKKAKKKKVFDPTKPIKSRGFSLPQLISFLPNSSPEPFHKNGWGLKFYRSNWTKYPEPTYWTVTKVKPGNENVKAKLWGILTWRGKSTNNRLSTRPL
jgi:hypothetical protein